MDEDSVDDDGRFRYFHACENNAALFDTPQVINNDTDFERFMQDLTEMDHLEFCRVWPSRRTSMCVSVCV